MQFMIGLVMGTFIGVALMCLMNMASDCTGDCNQGRACTCSTDLPIGMQRDDFPSVDWAARMLRNIAAVAGFAAMLALIAFFWGFKS